MKSIKPRRAITLNCKACLGTGTGKACGSRVCQFNGKLPTLQRIKAGCRECAGEDGPEACTGKLAGGQRRIMADLLGVPLEDILCPLHPYRMGKDPYSRRGKHTRTAEQLAKFAKKLEVRRVLEENPPLYSAGE